MPRGGKRPGTGSKLGVKRGPYNSTITKAEQREAIRRVVDQHVHEMLAAQITHAKGLKYLVTRDAKTGKFVRVTKEMAEQRLEDPNFLVEMWEKEPSVQAFTDLMNRAYDKPKEQEQEHTVQGKIVLEIAKPW